MAAAMDVEAKKHALRLVPYGLYLLGTRRADGTMQVSLASWFTQTSFDPPLVVVGLHREGAGFEAVQQTGVLSLNILGTGQTDVLKGFFKHVDVAEGKAGKHPIKVGATGCPLMPELPAAIECEVLETVELGDHATVVCKVVAAHVFDKAKAALSHGEAKLHYAG
jgi:flavin reductase (DIM6/NTAB) family NADH-FMN oxidoreductase RutF